MWDLFRDTIDEWTKDKAPTLAAALAYFTIFSLAPLIIIAIAIAGLVFGEEAARGAVFEQVRSAVGDDAARIIQAMIASAGTPRTGIVGISVGVGALLLGASGVFGQLKESLNTIWGAKPKSGGGLGGFVKDKLPSFAMVLGIGFLLVVSLALSALLAAFSSTLTNVVPGQESILRLLNFLVSFGAITLLFAMIFKVLPDVALSWTDVRLAAGITSLLFTIGKELIGLYIGFSGVATAYGVAGSLVVILLWIFYSSLILFFGAEFTKVYARKRGSHAALAGVRAGQEERQGGGGEAAPPRVNTSTRPGDTPAGMHTHGGLPALALAAFLLALAITGAAIARLRHLWHPSVTLRSSSRPPPLGAHGLADLGRCFRVLRHPNDGGAQQDNPTAQETKAVVRQFGNLRPHFDQPARRVREGNQEYAGAQIHEAEYAGKRTHGSPPEVDLCQMSIRNAIRSF